MKRINKELYSHVCNNVESMKEFIRLNKLKQKDITCVIVVWEE